jgi:hypothetical protein
VGKERERKYVAVEEEYFSVQTLMPFERVVNSN